MPHYQFKYTRTFFILANVPLYQLPNHYHYQYMHVKRYGSYNMTTIVKVYITCATWTSKGIDIASTRRNEIGWKIYSFSILALP